MIRAIIIDDEPPARRVLQALLNHYSQDIEIVGLASSAEEGKELIQLEKPDLIFLDVEMPHLDGFGMLRQFEMINFDIIFTTAYSKYAIKAIQFSAFDYLLKPIDPEKLKIAIDRYKEKKIASKGIHFLPDDFARLKNQDSKIALPCTKGYKVIQISNLIYCEASKNYTIFYLEGNSKIIVGKNLKYFNEKLSEFGFFRIHESFLINLSHIKQYIKGRGGQVILSNDAVLTVSRSKKDAFLKLFLL